MIRRESAVKTPKASRRLEREAYLTLHRTVDFLARGAEEAIKPFGLSGTQYNLLRILRGAGANGLCCREVAERMLTRDPDITRLLDRLERRGLVARARASADRRVITVRITPSGLRILAKLNKPIAECHRRQLGHLGPRLLQQLIDIPKGYEPAAMMAVGYLGDPESNEESPRQQDRPRRARKPLESLFFEGTWGKPWSVATEDQSI